VSVLIGTYWSLVFGGSYGAYIARCKRGGYAGGPRRAAFWRSLGFPNLVRARAAKARFRLERLKREEWALARSVNPYALPEDAHLWASVAREQGLTVRKDLEFDTPPLQLNKRRRGF
jgi:hypothetical protein